MRRNQVIYGILLVFHVWMFLWGSRPYFLAAAILLVVLPVILRIMLYLEAGQIQIALTADATARVKEDRKLTFTLSAPGHLWAVGLVRCYMLSDNILFGEREEKNFFLPFQNDTYEFSMDTAICGETEYRIRAIEAFDIFGLCRQEVHLQSYSRVCIYPDYLPLELLPVNEYAGVSFGEQYYQNRKGNDVTEIFELRDYHPGDDMRRIHWNLTGKTGHLVYKEGSLPSLYQTVLLFDAGREADGKKIPHSLLMAALQLCVTFSREMIARSQPHYFAYPTPEELCIGEVSDVQGHWKTVGEWMRGPLPEESGRGFQYFQIRNLSRYCSKLVYFTVNAFPDGLNYFGDDLIITVLNVVEEGEAIHTADHGNLRVLEIPAGLLYTQRNRINI